MGADLEPSTAAALATAALALTPVHAAPRS